MTSGRVMVRGAFLSGVGMLLSMAGSLGAAVIFGHVLPESDVGVFWLLVLVSDCLLLVSSFGLHSALPKIVAGAQPEDRGRLGGSILLVQMMVSAGFGILVFLAWSLIPNPAALSRNENWVSLFPVLWSLPFLFLAATQRDTGLAIMAGLNRFAPRAAALVWAAGANFALVALFVWWMNGGLVSLILSTLASYVVAALWLSLYVLQGGRARPRWSDYGDAVRFSVPLYINNLLGFVFQRLDTVLVAVLLGQPAIVAYYEMAKRLPNMFGRVLVAMLVPYLPGISTRLALGDRAGAARLLEKTVGLVAFLGYGSALAVLVIQRPLIVLLFSEKYLNSLPVLWLLMTGTCLAMQAGVFGQSLIAMGRPGLVTWSNTASAAFSIIANCVLIPAYGIVGASLTFVITVLVSALLQGLLARRNGMRANVVKLAIPQIAMGIALAIGQLWPSYAGRLVALALFVGLCLGSSVISARQLAQVAGFLVPRRFLWKCGARTPHD